MKRQRYYDIVTWVLLGAGVVIGARLYERRLYGRVLGYVNSRLSLIRKGE